jgi:tetratricopeptide (TPR) repeat protein
MRASLLLFMLLLAAAPEPVAAQSDPAALASAGWTALQQDEPDAAADLFTRALADRPTDPNLHLGVGAAAHMQGDEDAATAALARALELDPTLAHASKLLAEIAYRRGDLQLAIGIYERAMDHAPDSAELAARLERLTEEASRRAADTRVTVSVTGAREDALAAHATQTVSSTYWRVARLIGAYPADIIDIELNTARPFHHPGLKPGPADRKGSGRVAIDAGGAGSDLDGFTRVLNHALAHAMITSMAPTGVPDWLAEGFAQLAEPADVAGAERRLRTAGLIPWPSEGPSRPGQRQADVNLLIARALVDRIGAQSTVLLDELADGRSLDDALAQFGFSYADLQADVTSRLQ